MQNLVLIHGWAVGSWIWEDFIPYLQAHWKLTIIDLPGYGRTSGSRPTDQKQHNIDQIAQQIATSVPENAILLGWSLGGMIATRLAHIRQDIRALVLLASSPCFINRVDWQHGVRLADFQDLLKQLKQDKRRALQNFVGLIATGDQTPRQTIKKLSLMIQDHTPDTITLEEGLEILYSQDLRHILAQQHCPVAMILGARDVLVKNSTAKAIQAIRQDISSVEIKAAGHAPFLSCPEQTADALIEVTKNL